MNIVYLSILSNVLIINDSIAFKYHIYKIKILSKAQTFIVYLSILSNNIALKRIFSILITREITDQKSGSVLIMSTDMTRHKDRIRILMDGEEGEIQGRTSFS